MVVSQISKVLSHSKGGRFRYFEVTKPIFFQYLPYGRLRGEVVSKDVRISPNDKVDQAVVAYLSSGETTSNQSPPRYAH